MMATFNHYWSGVAGGPCPACGLYGDLLRLHGEFGPDGVRNISHFGDGMVRECQYPADVGWVKTKDGRWWFEPEASPTYEQLRDRVAELERLLEART